MTVTPDDVHNILGIPIDGKAMTGDAGGSRAINYNDAVELVHKQLGVTTRQADEEMDNTRMVRLEWLRTNFKGSKESDSRDRKERVAKAFLLHLMGCGLCPNKTGDKVGVFYLQCMTDLTRISEISWGSGVLTHLYRELGVASRFGSRSITGCMSLLQTWIYEHFPTLGRRQGKNSYMESKPRICKHEPYSANTQLAKVLVAIREQLDDLLPIHVIWDPYQKHRDHFPLTDISFYIGLMVCFDVSEPYHPDRVLRQFGRVQTIPTKPLGTITPRVGSTASSYRCTYYTDHWHWNNWQDHTIQGDRRSTPVERPSDCANGYMDWYVKVSHPRVQNPVRRIRVPGAPASGKFAQRLQLIAEYLLTCEGAGRPVSPRKAHAAHLIELYTTEGDLEEFDEVAGGGEEDNSSSKPVVPARTDVDDGEAVG